MKIFLHEDLNVNECPLAADISWKKYWGLFQCSQLTYRFQVIYCTYTMNVVAVKPTEIQREVNFFCIFVLHSPLFLLFIPLYLYLDPYFLIKTVKSYMYTSDNTDSSIKLSSVQEHENSMAWEYAQIYRYKPPASMYR
jgi:hypothetical protein